MDNNKTPNPHRRPAPEPSGGWTPPWPDGNTILHWSDYREMTPPAKLPPSDSWADEITEPKLPTAQPNSDTPPTQERLLPELDPSQPPRASASQGSLVAGWLAQRLFGDTPVRVLALGALLLCLLALAQALGPDQAQPVAWWILELLEVHHASTC